MPCGCMTCISVIELYKYVSYLSNKTSIFLMNLSVLSVTEKRIQSNMDVQDSCISSAKFAEDVYYSESLVYCRNLLGKSTELNV